jgi:hypothetical protein
MIRSRGLLRSFTPPRAVAQSFSQGVQRRSFTASSSPKSDQRSPFSFFAWYTKQIDAHPLLTKAITAGVVGGAGDLSSQIILSDEEHKKPNSTVLERIDWQRTARFVFMNVAMVGPTLHYWYRWLGKKFPGKSIKSVAICVFMDEVIFTPLYYPVFLTALWKLEHGDKLSYPKIGSMLWTEMPALILTEWILWIPAQVVNFRFVRGKFQVLFVNMVGIFWNGYLSWMAQKAHGNAGTDSTNQVKEDVDAVGADLGNSDNKLQPVAALPSQDSAEKPASESNPETTVTL